MPAAPLPFVNYRQSSASSVDVQLEENGPFVGLASVAGVDVAELLRHAKDGFAGQPWKFLTELPRLLMWAGCEAVKTTEDGAATFTEGQALAVELEDGETGEIEEKSITCTVATGTLAEANAEAKAAEGAASWNGLPKVGLDHGHGHSHGGMPCHGHGHGHGHDEDEDEEGDDEEDSSDDETDAKALPPHPQHYRMRSLHELLTDTCGLATMLPLPGHIVRECWVAAGGELVDSSVVDGLGAGGDDEDHHGGAQAGGPQCQQQ